MVSSVSGMSSGDCNFSHQVNTAPAFSTTEVLEDESIFGKKGGGGGAPMDAPSIFMQCSDGADSYPSVSDSGGIVL